MWQRGSSLLLASPALTAGSAAAQVEVTVHGGLHPGPETEAGLDDPYTPHLGTPSSPGNASRMRHDFVALPGFSWRSA
jgi:hypothetical protein